MDEMSRHRASPFEPQGGAERVGLFGGSFNPAHRGHVAVADAARRALRLDRVLLLVSPQSPLKSRGEYRPFEQRMAEAARLFEGRPWAVVSDFERRAGLRYTADTVKTLKDRSPATRFVWLMGADSLGSFHRWRDWRSIASSLPMLVLSRPGEERAALTSVAARALWRYRLPPNLAVTLPGRRPPAWCYLPAVHDETSATAIREAEKGADA